MQGQDNTITLEKEEFKNLIQEHTRYRMALQEINNFISNKDFMEEISVEELVTEIKMWIKFAEIDIKKGQKS